VAAGWLGQGCRRHLRLVADLLLAGGGWWWPVEPRSVTPCETRVTANWVNKDGLLWAGFWWAKNTYSFNFGYPPVPAGER
jgi:hypothetical protein